MRAVYQPSGIGETQDVAKQVASGQDKIPPELTGRKDKLISAGILLVTLFDYAMVQANRARARAGLSDAIKRRQEQGSRYYYAPGPQGGERTLMLCIALPLVGGDIFGGAYIRPGCATDAIYVIPSIDAEPPQWRVHASGTALTAADIDDLFQATFNDDAEAANRLAPLYGCDPFVTPWS
jgi:hypothetical protein